MEFVGIFIFLTVVIYFACATCWEHGFSKGQEDAFNRWIDREP
jgi:hypothetical protein